VKEEGSMNIREKLLDYNTSLTNDDRLEISEYLFSLLVDPWIRMDDRRPAYGEPVLIRIGLVVQHITYTLDGGDECEDWFEPYHFDHDDDLKIPWSKVQYWRGLDSF